MLVSLTVLSCLSICCNSHAFLLPMLWFTTKTPKSFVLDGLFQMSYWQQSKLRIGLRQRIGFFSNTHTYFSTYAGNLHCAALYAASVELSSLTFYLTSMFSHMSSVQHIDTGMGKSNMVISGVLNTPNANGFLFEILNPVEFLKLG